MRVTPRPCAIALLLQRPSHPEFLRGGLPHTFHLHRQNRTLSCKRVIEVQDDRIRLYVYHAKRQLFPIWSGCRVPIACGQGYCRRKQILGDTLYLLRIVVTKHLSGGQIENDFLPNNMSGQFFLQTSNIQDLIAMEVREGRSSDRGIDHSPGF